MNIITYRALDSKVLAVAVHRAELDLLLNAAVEHMGWTAYIAAVPGLRHEHEVEQAAAHGSKLSEPIARAIFPELSGPFAQ